MAVLVLTIAGVALIRDGDTRWPLWFLICTVWLLAPVVFAPVYVLGLRVSRLWFADTGATKAVEPTGTATDR